MNRIELREDRLIAGRFSLEMQRTLRVPSDGRRYPLPPGFSSFPIYRTADYARGLPAEWVERGDFFVPLYQHEALWLRFEAAEWKPNAVQIGSGGVNVLTGERFPSRLRKKPQNYVVCPLQPWLDGFKTAAGAVRQFVAAPFQRGLTVAEQLEGDAQAPALHLRVIEPQRGFFPDKPPKGFHSAMMYEEALPAGALGLAAGGAIEQNVYRDPHALRTWNENDALDVRILIVNSDIFRALTGKEPPPSPVSAENYTRAGLPWFEFYEERHRDIGARPAMKSVKPLDLGEPSVTPTNVRVIRRRSRKKEST